MGKKSNSNGALKNVVEISFTNIHGNSQKEVKMKNRENFIKD